MENIWCDWEEGISEIRIEEVSDSVIPGYAVDIEGREDQYIVCVGLQVLEDHLNMLESIGFKVPPVAYERLHLKRQEQETNIPQPTTEN